MVFRVDPNRVDWMDATFRTITPNHGHVQKITIYVLYRKSLSDGNPDTRQAFGERIFGHWMELDKILAQLCESRSIRPEVLYFPSGGTEEAIIECMGRLLPEITRRGMIYVGRMRW